MIGLTCVLLWLALCWTQEDGWDLLNLKLGMHFVRLMDLIYSMVCHRGGAEE